jgi:hypothetical protein
MSYNVFGLALSDWVALILFAIAETIHLRPHLSCVLYWRRFRSLALKVAFHCTPLTLGACVSAPRNGQALSDIG